MKTLRFVPVFVLLCLHTISLQSQVRSEISFPDIPGYITLKCDFHVHTCFSDGTPWPTERVREAWSDGLDVIAITDHIEYRPNAAYICNDLNAPWEIAHKKAEEFNIIVIKGAEITRNMPPGHFNALFLNDVNALVQDTFMDAVEAAIKQDAFVFWNHPGWRQGAPDTPYWYPVHLNLIKKGWMHGIEVVNWDWYYPEAHEGALVYGLTMMGNSDIHEPVSLAKEADPEWHRPITLVFADERSSEGVKMALKDGRTALWYKQKLYAKEEFALPLIAEAVEIRSPLVVLNGRNKGSLILHNNSDLEICLVPKNTPKGLKLPESITIPPKQTIAVAVSASAKMISGLTDFSIEFQVSNVFTAPGQNLLINLDIRLFAVSGLSIKQQNGLYYLATGELGKADIRFTTNGSYPVLSSGQLSQPLKAGIYSLNYRCWLEGKPLEHLFTSEIAVHKGVSGNQTLVHQPEEQYAASGSNALCDGMLGTDEFRSGQWLGFYHDIDATLVLEKPVSTDSIVIRFLKDEDSWIFVPQQVFVEISSDGVNFKRIPLKAVRKEGKIHHWVFSTKGKKIKAVKAFVPHPGVCPPNHAGAGQPAWIFTDEIMVY